VSAEPGRRPGSVACPRPKCGLRFVSRDVDTLDVCVRGSGGSSRVAWYRRECPVTCDALFLICVVTGSCRAVGVDALVARSSVEARTPRPPRARTGAGGAAGPGPGKGRAPARISDAACGGAGRSRPRPHCALVAGTRAPRPARAPSRERGRAAGPDEEPLRRTRYPGPRRTRAVARAR
jgi:hypothetical protein